jgi:hypothetical protein
MDARAKAQARDRARRYRARKRGEDAPKKKPGPAPGRSYTPEHYRREDNLVTFMGWDPEGHSLWKVAGRIAGNPYVVTHWDGHEVGRDEWVDPLAGFHYDPGESTYSFLTTILFDGLRLEAKPGQKGELVQILRAAAADRDWSIPVFGSTHRILLSDKGRKVLLDAAQDLESGAPYAQEKDGLRPSLANSLKGGTT